MLHYDHMKVCNPITSQATNRFGMEFYLVIALLYVYLLGNVTQHVHLF